jgi:hypothetical protein
MPSLKLWQLKKEKNNIQLISHLPGSGQRLNPSQMDCPSPSERGRGEAGTVNNDQSFHLRFKALAGKAVNSNEEMNNYQCSIKKYNVTP